MKAIGNTQDDEAWLALVRQGDVQAFESLYNRYKFQLSANVLKMVKSATATEDIIHDVFLGLWNNRHQLDASRSPLGYLYRMSENKVMDFFRKAAQDLKLRDHIITISQEGYRHVEERLQAKEVNALIHEAVQRLPQQCRRVFTLCKLEGLSSEEAARQLDVSIHTVSNHLAKANRLVKEYLVTNIKDPAVFSSFFFLILAS